MKPLDLAVAVGVNNRHTLVFRGEVRHRIVPGTDGWTRVEGMLGSDDLSIGLAAYSTGQRCEPLQAACLWVHADNGKRVAALERFRFTPSFLIRLGPANVWGVWAIDRDLSYEQAERGNRKLAYCLGCVMARGGLDTVVPVPGSILRAGRTRGLLVKEDEGASRVIYGRDFFLAIRRMKEPPKPDAWRDAA